jgi:hypothetical protein
MPRDELPEGTHSIISPEEAVYGRKLGLGGEIDMNWPGSEEDDDTDFDDDDDFDFDEDEDEDFDFDDEDEEEDADEDY